MHKNFWNSVSPIGLVGNRGHEDESYCQLLWWHYADQHGFYNDEQCLCILIHQFKLKVPPPHFLCTSIAGMICADREIPRLVTLFSLAITPSSPRLDL